jgi:hypothetical protein
VRKRNFEARCVNDPFPLFGPGLLTPVEKVMRLNVGFLSTLIIDPLNPAGII